MKTFTIGQLEIDVLRHVRVDGSRFPTPDPSSIADYFVINARWQGNAIDFYPNQGKKVDPLAFGFVGKKVVIIRDENGEPTGATKRGGDFRGMRFWRVVGRRLGKAVLARQLGKRVGELTRDDLDGAQTRIAALLTGNFTPPQDTRLMTLDDAARFFRDADGALDEGEKPPGTVVNIDTDYDADCDASTVRAGNSAVAVNWGTTAVNSRGVARFPLASVGGPTVNDADVQVNITSENIETTDTANLYSYNSTGQTDPSGDAGTPSTMLSRAGAGSVIATETTNYQTTGSKSTDLGATGKSHLAAALAASSTYYSIGWECIANSNFENYQFEAIENAGTDPATLTVDYSSSTPAALTLQSVAGVAAASNLVVGTPRVTLGAVAGVAAVSNLNVQSPAILGVGAVAGVAAVSNLNVRSPAILGISAVAGIGAVSNLVVASPAPVVPQSVAGVASVSNLAVASPITVVLQSVAGVATAANLTVGTPLVTLQAIAGVASLANVAVAAPASVALGSIAGVAAVTNLAIGTPIVTLQSVAGVASVANLTVGAVFSAMVLQSIAGAASAAAVVSGPATVVLGAVAGVAGLENVVVETAFQPLELQAVAGVADLPNVALASPAPISLDAIAGNATVGDIEVGTPLITLQPVGGVASALSSVWAPSLIDLDAIAGVAALPNVAVSAPSPRVTLQPIDGVATATALLTTPIRPSFGLVGIDRATITARGVDRTSIRAEGFDESVIRRKGQANV